MSKMITLSSGKQVSEETVELALVEYFIKHPKEKPYQFWCGDVVENEDGDKRIIIKLSNGDIGSFSCIGVPCSIGQDKFERAGYRKIGELKDYIK